MVDLLGLGLLVIGLALIVAELTFPGYYIGVAGTLGVAMGLIQMIWTGFLTNPISGLIAALVSVVAGMFMFQFYRRFPSPINELGGAPNPDLVGKTGIVIQPVRPHTTQGRVEIEGKIWGADAEQPLPPTTKVVVERTANTHIIVREVQQERPSDQS